VIEAFSARLNDGDLEGALALYEPGATFAASPDAAVSGEDAIRAALERFLALAPRMTGKIDKVLEAGDTALVVNAWTLEGTQPGDGAPVRMAGRSADVVRRQPDGGWKVVIDDPWGGGA
jgi:uncharacterized protein (TIGR02246 family)